MAFVIHVKSAHPDWKLEGYMQPDDFDGGLPDAEGTRETAQRFDTREQAQAFIENDKKEMLEYFGEQECADAPLVYTIEEVK